MGDWGTAAVKRWVLPELLQHIRNQSEDSKEEEADLGGSADSGTGVFAGDGEGMDVGL